MRFDPITWGVWTFGLALLLYWCYQTIHEFKILLRQHKTERGEPRT